MLPNMGLGCGGSYSQDSLLPVCIARFASQRAQPLENLTALPVDKKGARATQPLEQILRSEFL